MKNTITFFMLAFISINLFAQNRLSDSLSKLNNEELSHYYSVKAKNQKTAGAILGVCGMGMALIGFGMAMEDFASGDWLFPTEPYQKSGNGATVLAVLGTVAMVSSIPLTIASKRNQRTARILLQTNKTTLTPSFKISQTAVGIAIPL